MRHNDVGISTLREPSHTPTAHGRTTSISCLGKESVWTYGLGRALLFSSRTLPIGGPSTWLEKVSDAMKCKDVLHGVRLGFSAFLQRLAYLLSA